MTVSGEDTLRNLLPRFYKMYNLDDDGGNSDPKVKIEITQKIFFYIPNFSSRRKTVLKHDIHHIITEYPSNLKGETEIGAWEIASGCKRYWVAWVLNLHGFIMGFWINLPGIYRAFVRGRRSENLYTNVVSDNQALEMKVRELRELLSIPSNQQKLQPGIVDFLSFIFWLIVAGIYAIASIVVLPLIIIYNIFVFANSPKHPKPSKG